MRTSTHAQGHTAGWVGTRQAAGQAWVGYPALTWGVAAARAALFFAVVARALHQLSDAWRVETPPHTRMRRTAGGINHTRRVVHDATTRKATATYMVMRLARSGGARVCRWCCTAVTSSHASGVQSARFRVAATGSPSTISTTALLADNAHTQTHKITPTHPRPAPAAQGVESEKVPGQL